MPRLHAIGLALVISVLGSTALAHVDLSGAWGQRFHEDLPDLIAESPVMRPVLENLTASLTKHPREAYLVYGPPHLARLVDEIPVLTRHYHDPYCIAWKTNNV